MPILSDNGLKQAIEKGLLRIEPLLNKDSIGSASIDLHVSDTLYIPDFKRLGCLDTRQMEEVIELPFDQYVEEYATPLQIPDQGYVLEPNNFCYIKTLERVSLARGLKASIATRSTSARRGFRIYHLDDRLSKGEGIHGVNIPLLLSTLNVAVKLPKNFSICQMVVQQGPPEYLSKEEIEQAINDGEIEVSGNPTIVEDSIVLTYGPTILAYIGGLMNPEENNSGCFREIDIREGCVLTPHKFYLALTRETVRIGPRYVGVLKGTHDLGFVHLNAPYHWPGSNHRITLEVTYSYPKEVKEGLSACRLFIYPLYPECSRLYNDRYSGQVTPLG